MILFHGSPTDDLKVLTPATGKRPLDMSIRPRIFASPSIKTAIIHARDWIGRDLASGTINGVHYLKELTPGGLKYLDGPGHLYGILDNKPFRPLHPDRSKPRGWDLHMEYISEKAVPVIHLLEIPNVLDLLRAIQMKIVPYGMKESYLSGRWDTPGEFDPIDIHNLQRAEFAAEFASRSVGPMAKKAADQARDLIYSLPDNFQVAHAGRVRTIMDKTGLGEETLVHFSRDPFKTLRPLTYEELVKDRTRGRWENQPEMAQKYMERRKRYEGAFRSILKKAGLPYDPKKSFLYYTILGKHLLKWAKGRYEHRIPLSPEVIRETFFDVVGLPKEAGRVPPPKDLFANKGLERALRLWEEYKHKVKAHKYMNMTIFPRIEVLTQKEFTPEIWRDGEKLNGGN